MRLLLSKGGVAFGTLIFVLIFNFFLFRIASDPAQDLRRNPRYTEEQAEILIEERGLNAGLLTQFRIYAINTIQGDLDVSYSTGRPVLTEIREAVPNTLLLVGTATVLSALLGSWLGVVAASRRGRSSDTAITQGSLILYSMPEFWLGMMLIWLLAVTVGAFPTGLKSDPGADLTGVSYMWNVLQHAALPIMTLTLGLLAQYVVIMRSALTDVLNEDFVDDRPRDRAAATPGPSRPRGAQRPAPGRDVDIAEPWVRGLGRHHDRGTVLLARHRLAHRGGDRRQGLPMLQGIFLLTSFAVIVVNLVADLLLAYLDPRVRVA